MNVAAVSATDLSAVHSTIAKSMQAWQKLEQSLASGDLASAQSAFSTYQQFDATITAMSGGSIDSPQVTSSMSALGTALKSGNLSSAQSVFSTLQDDMGGMQSAGLSPMNQGPARVKDQVDLNSSSANSGTQAPAVVYGTSSSSVSSTVDLGQQTVDKAIQDGAPITVNTGVPPTPVDLAEPVAVNEDALGEINEYL